MLKDLYLYDSELTVSKVLEILSVDSPAIYDGTYSNLDLEMSFLEFFEALLGCAEVKGQRIQTDVESQIDTDHQEDTVLSSLQSSLSEETERSQSPVLAFKEQLEAGEKQEEDGNREVPNNDVNCSPSTPMTSTTSVISKQSVTSGSKKKK
ncbi:radial spoke head 10 homolog B-like [Sinocyclocheilus rhinocerous]|uniref:radial spoke head 10 homolog B-like n=1 Tax=Sinocyclocheilus rhinocerous TaxID=307959 RepID=UPI0007B89775|nr:PREDICTED: radial spoke head 10 homolog B-like [Sinocyclocheilus rhinocerous]